LNQNLIVDYIHQ